MISRNGAGAPADAEAFEVRSAASRYVVFLSNANNLLAGVNSSLYQVYRFDLQTASLELVSATQGGIAANGGADSLAVSADGNQIAFKSFSTDISPAFSSNPYRTIASKNMSSGAVINAASSSGGTMVDASGNHVPAVSADGLYVAFSSDGNNLVSGGSGQQAYRKKLSDGAIELISQDDGGTVGNGTSFFPALNPTGNLAVFCSDATNFNVSPGAASVYLKNLTTGALTLVSKNELGAAVAMDSAYCAPELLADGTRVVFETSAAAVSTIAANGYVQVYLRNKDSGTVTLVSRSQSGVMADASIDVHRVTPDGKYALLLTAATNLIDGRSFTAGPKRLFRKNLLTGAVALASSGLDGSANNSADVTSADLSADGTTITFVTSEDFLGLGTAVPQAYVKYLEP